MRAKNEMAGLKKLASANEELKKILDSCDVLILLDKGLLAETDDLAIVEHIANDLWELLFRLSAIAKEKGVPFYPHDLKRLDSDIGLDNLIGLMGNKEVKEILETEVDKMVKPFLTEAEWLYNAAGYFLSAMLSKFCARLNELRRRI